jgi:hypothetical protein
METVQLYAKWLLDAQADVEPGLCAPHGLTLRVHLSIPFSKWISDDE